jgi:hypothetical protein
MRVLVNPKTIKKRNSVTQEALTNAKPTKTEDNGYVRIFHEREFHSKRRKQSHEKSRITHLVENNWFLPNSTTKMNKL